MTRSEEARQSGCRTGCETGAGQELRRAAAAALGLLEVGDVEGAKAVLREGLAAGTKGVGR